MTSNALLVKQLVHRRWPLALGKVELGEKFDAHLAAIGDRRRQPVLKSRLALGGERINFARRARLLRLQRCGQIIQLLKLGQQGIELALFHAPDLPQTGRRGKLLVNLIAVSSTGSDKAQQGRFDGELVGDGCTHRVVTLMYKYNI